MTGIIDYAHTETRSFADLPFNEIDALIISTLIYEDVASVCPTLMLDETRSGSFAARIRAFEPKHMPTTSRTKPKWFQWSTRT